MKKKYNKLLFNQ